MLVDGDISYAIRMTRVLNRLETFILPKLVAKRAVRNTPQTFTCLRNSSAQPVSTSRLQPILSRR